MTELAVRIPRSHGCRSHRELGAERHRSLPRLEDEWYPPGEWSANRWTNRRWL